MNWILTLTKNNLNLTKRAIDTFRNQDIGDVKIIVIDNGSTDNTPQWLATQPDLRTVISTGMGVAQSWNYGLRWLFNSRWSDGSTPVRSMTEYCLVVNNDVELRPDTYRRLVDDGGPFVTAVGSQDPKCVIPFRGGTEVPFFAPPDPRHTRPHPDFSCFLIRAEVFNKVGPFDEGFHGAYCEDGDYDLRMWMAGIRGYCIDLPYLHLGAQTVKNASKEEARKITDQAGRNREYFREKHGFYMGSEAYYKALDKGGPTGAPTPSSSPQLDGLPSNPPADTT